MMRNVEHSMKRCVRLNFKRNAKRSLWRFVSTLTTGRDENSFLGEIFKCPGFILSSKSKPVNPVYFSNFRECTPKSEPKCEIVHEEECQTEYKKDCKEVEQEVCVDVPKENCYYVPSSVCSEVTQKVCARVNYQETCNYVPIKECKQVEKEVCSSTQVKCSIVKLFMVG